MLRRLQDELTALGADPEPEALAVLALPDAVLRGLSNEYLATLPRETRAAIEKRPGRAAASRRSSARRRILVTARGANITVYAIGISGVAGDG